MKKMKKFLAFALALVMCLGMATTALAAEGSITVKGANNAEYKAYLIFAGTGTDNNMSYTATGAVEAYLNDQKDTEGFPFTLVDNGGSTYVTVNDAEKAAQWVQNNIDSLIGSANPVATVMAQETSVGSGKYQAVFSNLAYGYYYVVTGTETNGSAVMLTSVNGNEVINEKHGTPGFGEDPDSGKKAKETTYQIGEEIEYTINYKKALNYVNGELIAKYTVKDTFPTGIELVANSLEVKVNGTPISFNNTATTGIEGEIAWSQNGTNTDGEAVKVPMYEDAPSVITITYRALVTKDFVTGNSGATNEVEISYETEGGKTPETPDKDKETVYSGKIIVDKYEKDNTNKKLSGAEFVVSRTTGEDDAAVTEYMTTATVDGKTVIGWAVQPENTDIVDIPNIYKVVTDGSGAATFVGLKAGTYTLVEVKAPEGYNLEANGTPITLTVPEIEGEAVVNMEMTATVENSQGTLLPSTGGIGTTIFYVVGGILVAAAGVLLITKKRMSKEQ